LAGKYDPTDPKCQAGEALMIEVEEKFRRGILDRSETRKGLRRAYGMMGYSVDDDNLNAYLDVLEGDA